MAKNTYLLHAASTRKRIGGILFAAATVWATSFAPPVIAQTSEASPSSYEDYVSDRDDPPIEEMLLEYEEEHPEAKIEHARQTNNSGENAQGTTDTTPMRKDVIPDSDERMVLQGVQSVAFKRPGCEAMWPSGLQVCGAILGVYRELGGQLSWLGPPKTNELTNPDGVGKRTEFVGGSIYWHPNVGAHAVTLDGMRQWGTLNWEAGPLGYPTSGPTDTNFPLTQKQSFQGGDNYYNPLTGGAVWGDIKRRYDEMGGSQHPIGIPISNETVNGDRYRYNNFSNGTISWRNDRQTRFMYLATQRVWAALGRETGSLGYPEKDEVAESPGVFHLVPFENRGVILWSAAYGARELTGQLYNYWHSVYQTADDLGIPIPSPLSAAESSSQQFTNAVAFGSGENIGIIRRTDAAPLRKDESFSVRSEMDTRQVQERAIPFANTAENSGTIVGGSAGKILRKLEWPVPNEGVRFVVRRGFYERYANGNDKGWGYEKLTRKHNMYNRDILYELIRQRDQSTVGGTAEGNYKYAGWVYFLDCRGYTFAKKQGCRNAENPIHLTTIFRPTAMNNYMNHPAKDPNKRNDSYPVGVVTAWCSSDPGGQRVESTGSRCPNYVNLYNQLRL